MTRPPPKKPGAAPKRKSGGAHALTGFAYQLLGSIDWSTAIAFPPAGADRAALRGVTVTLEPLAGGDAIHANPGLSTVLQYKTRGRGAWTDAAIVREVLPDLLKARPAKGTDAAYRFQTNAAVRLSPAFVRLQDLLRDHPLKAALALGDAEQLEFRTARRGPAINASAFLAWAAEAAAPGTQSGAARLAAQRRVAAVLARLAIEAEQAETAMRERVNARLSRVIAHPEKADQVRRTLLGTLMDYARQGGMTVPVSEIFERCGILAAQFRSAAEFEAAFSGPAIAALQRLGYDAKLDSRGAPPVLGGDEPLALCGPSGVGKTWTLARSASEALRRGDLVVWIERPGSPADVRAQVANLLQAARGQSEQIDSSAVRTVADAIVGDADRYRISVFLDRFSSPEHAVAVLADPWWAAQATTVVAAMPAAGAGDTQLPRGIRGEEIRDFSLPELRRYLLSRGADWTGLPSDLRRFLRRPNLAKLYADHGRGWGPYRPENEYQLINRAWAQQPAEGSQGAWRSSFALVRARLTEMLADFAAGRPVAYPWPRQHPAAPFGDSDIERLERAGLLRWTADGRLTLDHDRLLAWGLAEAALGQLAAGTVDGPSLCRNLSEATTPGRPSPLEGHALGYVALDLLWGLLTDDAEPSGLAVEVAKQFLAAPNGIRWGDLATLGPKGFRLALAAAEQFSVAELPMTRELGQALAATAPERIAASDYRRIGALLASADRERRSVALAVLTARPNAAFLKRVVSLRALCRAQILAETGDFGRLHAEMEAAFDAAQAIALAQPKALGKVAEGDVTALEAQTIAWLILGLPPTIAISLWPQLQRVSGQSEEDARARIETAAVQLKPTPAAIEGLAQRTAKSGYEFSVLGAVAPDRALEVLKRARGANLQKLADRLGPLLRRKPGADALIATRLGKGGLAARDVAFGMRDWAPFAGRRVWAAMGADFAKGTQEKGWDRVLDRLAEASNMALLDYLRGQRGKAVEHRAAAMLDVRLPAHLGRWKDHELSAAEGLLLRIGGPAFERLVLQRLVHPNDIEQDYGLRDALIASGPKVAAAVADFVWRNFEKTSGAHLPLKPIETLCLVDPVGAGRLARRALASRFRGGVWLAGEIAAQTSNAPLAKAVCVRFADPRALQNDHLELRLLDRLVDDRVREFKVARRALRRGDGFSRACAVWVGRRRNDRVLLAEVADAVLTKVTGSGSHRDAEVLGELSHDPEIGPAVLERLRALPERHLLRHLVGDADLASSWAKDPIVAEVAMDSAFQFESAFLNTPRDGQDRMWQVDPDVALEAFDEGLKRGGKASEGLAAQAIENDPKGAVNAILARYNDVEKGKVRTDIARALRASPDGPWLERLVLKRLDNEDGTLRVSGVEIAGWIASPAVMAALLRIEASDPRSPVRNAVDEAFHRVARLDLLKALIARIEAESRPGERRRMLAVAVTLDEDRVLTTPNDPLHLGRVVKDLREWRVVTQRVKR